MPDQIEIEIDVNGDPDPDPLPCRQGDKIIWTNRFSKQITTFTLPTCVSPQKSPAPIDVGETTRQFTVNKSAHGTFDYEYSWDDRAPRNGTIDVGAR
jgi:hypothetical protein